jgi:hypothetical protein
MIFLQFTMNYARFSHLFTKEKEKRHYVTLLIWVTRFTSGPSKSFYLHQCPSSSQPQRKTEDRGKDGLRFGASLASGRPAVWLATGAGLASGRPVVWLVVASRPWAAATQQQKGSGSYRPAATMALQEGKGPARLRWWRQRPRRWAAAKQQRQWRNSSSAAAAAAAAPQQQQLELRLCHGDVRGGEQRRERRGARAALGEWMGEEGSSGVSVDE